MLLDGFATLKKHFLQECCLVKIAYLLLKKKNMYQNILDIFVNFFLLT